MLVDVEDEAGHVLLLLDIHARHRLVEQQQVRLHRQRAAELDTLLQAIGQPADLHAANILNFEEVDDLLDEFAVLHLLAQRRPVTQQLPEEAALHLQRAPGHDVVERRHATKQRDVLERASDPAIGRLERPHLRAGFAAEGDAAFLRMIEAVDDVEHRGLAGAVRADDRADFALADIERHVGDRLHAAERQRHVLDRQQPVADPAGPGGARRIRHDLRIRRRHAAFPTGARIGSSAMSRIFTRAEITPLRPSSNVTWVEMSASVEPS